MSDKKQYSRNCPECGKLLTYCSYSSWYHSNKKNSLCWGCAGKHRTPPTKMNSKVWKGYGEISLTHFNQMKISAGKRGHLFDVTIEYLWDVFLKQNRKCSYTGLELTFPKTRKSVKVSTSSLDRIDSSKGYVEGNVQWVHKDINRMKQDFSNDYFIEMCNLVSKKTNKVNNFINFDIKLPTNGVILEESERKLIL